MQYKILLCKWVLENVNRTISILRNLDKSFGFPISQLDSGYLGL